MIPRCNPHDNAESLGAVSATQERIREPLLHLWSYGDADAYTLSDPASGFGEGKSIAPSRRGDRPERPRRRREHPGGAEGLLWLLRRDQLLGALREGIRPGPPHEQEDGSFAFGFPQGDTPLAGVAVEDVGRIVSILFERPQDYLGQVVGIVGDDLTGDQYAERMTRILGTRVTYRHVPRAEFAALGFPGAEDLANMCEFNRFYIPNRWVDVEMCRALNPKMQTFEIWLTSNKGAFARLFEREHARAH